MGWQRTYIVNTFEGRNHGVDVASALHAAIDTAIGHLNEHLEQCNNEPWNISNTAYHVLNKLPSSFSTLRQRTHLLHWLVVVLGVHKVSAAKFLS